MAGADDPAGVGPRFGAFEASGNGAWRHISPDARELLAIAPDTDWLEAIAPAQRVAVAGEWLSGLAGNEPFSLHFTTAAGESLRAEVAPLGVDGRWVGTLLRASSVPEASATEPPRPSLDGLFFANVGHALRTPLNGILGMAEVLRGGPLDAAQRGQLEALHGEARALSGLIDDILEMAHLDAASVAIEVQSLDGAALVEEVLASRRSSSTSGPVVKLGRCAGWVEADPKRLRQILTRLVDNAQKFAERGDVRIEAREEGGRWRLEVRDTGPGIPADEHESIFDAFTQVDASSTRAHGGLGLGLYVARQLARRMQGDVEVTSTLGEGATFVVWLPAGEPPTSDYPVPDLGAQTAALTVLMAEDNPANAALLKLILENDGHVVLHAVDGLQALELARQQTVDVALLDLHMPRMDGFETCQALLKRHPRLPIVAVTADTQPETERRCLEIGMLAMVRKPYEFDEIRAVLALTATS